LNFQDSKLFEQLAGKVHHIFARFDENYKCNDMAEWLSEHNIYQTPNFVYLKGNITIHVGDELVNLSAFQHGLGISGEDIDRIEIEENARVNKIITIENLTTYFRWQETESLIVYLGGYHNGVRRNLLQQIYNSFPYAKYYHFGDIDAGGFYIYEHLKCKTGIPFKTLHMNVDVLKKYSSQTKTLTQSDKKRIESLLKKLDDKFKQNAADEDYREVLQYMLENNCKLEQEAI